MEVNIKYFNDTTKLEKVDKGDWIDLRCAGIKKMSILNLITEGKNGEKVLTRSNYSTSIESEDGVFIGENFKETKVKFYRYKKGDFLLIDLGIAMQLPEGYEAYVIPRGSTFKNFTIMETNSMGIIDNSFRGDGDRWFMPVIAMQDGFMIYDERICQFRIQEKMEHVNFKEKEKFNAANRGSHGSSGTL